MGGLRNGLSATGTDVIISTGTAVYEVVWSNYGLYIVSALGELWSSAPAESARDTDELVDNLSGGGMTVRAVDTAGNS